MRFLKKKHILILLLGVFIFPSCRTKKTFNGQGALPCADYNNSPEKLKNKSKWKLVLYKDGEIIGKKKKKVYQILEKSNAFGND